MQEPHSTRLRELGALEHLFFWMNRKRPTHFLLATEISGAATVQEWRQALDAVQQRHAAFSIAIAALDSGAPEFVSMPGRPIPLRLVDGVPEDWEREAEREAAQPFSDSSAPLLRTTLMHGPERSILLLAAHHSIADGLSMLSVLRDLLSALAYPDRAQPALPVSPSADRLASRLDGFAHAYEPPAPREPLRYTEEGALPRLERAALSAQATTALQKRAGRESCTIHATLCAAMALALRAVAAPAGRTVRIASPVNMRAALGTGDQVGLYLGDSRIDFGLNAGRALWQLASFARCELLKHRSPQALLSGTRALGEVMQGIHDVEAAAHLASSAFAGDAVVTNMGVVPFASVFGRFRLEAVWGPALLMGFDHLPCLGAVTTDGQLRLLLAAYTPIPGLLSRVEELLVRSCAA